MAEYIANLVQTVAENANVQFTDTVVNGNCSIMHRAGSGLITLRGVASHCRTRFKVSFSANVQVPEGGTVAPLSFAIAINGEPIDATTMISTPATAEVFNNIASFTYVEVPHCDSVSISVRNTGTIETDIQNANLIIELA